MLLGIFVLASSLAFGFALVSRMEFADNLLLRLSIGMPIGIASYSGLSFLLDYLNGYVTGTMLGIAGIMLLLLAILLVLQGSRKRITTKLLKKQIIGKGIGIPTMLVVFLIVLYVVIEPIFAISAFYYHGVFYCENPGCSDNIFHISLGNSVLYNQFPPKLFLSYKVVNVFPFMYDFFDAIMLKYGLGLNGSLMIPEGIMVFSFIALSLLVAYRVTKSKLKTIFSLIIFWFGGVGFIQMLDYPFVSTLEKLFSPIHLLAPPLVGHGAISVINALVWVATDFITPWVSIINTMLIAQRDFILGLPIGLAIIYMLYVFAFEKREPSKKEAAFIGLCIGLLPLIHPLTFFTVFVIGLFSFALFVITARKKFRALSRAAIAVAVAAVISIPELLYIDTQHRSVNWFYYIYGSYIIHAHTLLNTFLFSIGNVIFLWVEMAGIPVVLCFLGLIYARREERLLFIPFLALWVIINIIAITANPADSNEIFLYIFLILSILTSELLYAMWKKPGYGKIIAIALIVLICINILFVFWSDNINNVQITESNAEMRSAAFIINNTPQNAIFAVSNYDTFNPVVPSLAARQTLVSIEVYVTGIQSIPLQRLVAANSGIIDSGNCTLIKEYNVSYIYLLGGNSASRQPFDNERFAEIYNSYSKTINGNITIYHAEC